MFINKFMESLLLLPIFLHKTQSPTKTQGINPMGLYLPWADNYLHNCKPSFLWHQAMMTSYCLTAWNSKMKNQLEELVPIWVKKGNINWKNLYRWTWIQPRKPNLPQNVFKGLNQWSFLPLGTTLIYTT